jgi:hypothetical protein
VDARLIFWPAVAMAALIFIVAVRMFLTRVAQMKRDRIRLQDVATSAQSAAKFTDSGPADNFRNLFELPVLLYLALVICFLTAQVNALTLGLAWAFVAARVIHSWIHCTYNRVRHRFYAFIIGFLVLIVLWAVLAAGLLR